MNYNITGFRKISNPEEAKRLSQYAMLSVKKASDELKSLYLNDIDHDYCIELTKQKFGKPSYEVSGMSSGSIKVWMLKSEKNIFYIEIWDNVNPTGFYIHCKENNKDLHKLMKWYRVNSKTRNFQVIKGGKR